MARTRMWRTMVAVIRGENLGGAAWQRPQLERNRLSPQDESLILRGWNRSSRGGSRSIFRCILWGVFAVAAGESGQTQEHGTCQKRAGIGILFSQ